ncbi:MAG: UDP-3-O-(3-hydroxymyristoyl)glucosamine N-acyltransferase [Ignavibacteria bacterium]
MKVVDIAKYVSGNLESYGLNPDIVRAGKIESAAPDEITFISNPLYEKYFKTTQAGAILVSNEFKLPEQRTDVAIIRVRDPYLAFVSLLELFEKDKTSELTGISSNCHIGNNSVIGDDVYIEDFVFIGNDVKIGNQTKIYANTTIGDNVIIGNNCVIYSNVSIYKGCRIGNNVIIHSGTVIGSDGFGFAKQEDGTYRKIPQTGIVVIDNDVEIGSNCTIDRATIGETRLCRGVKLDNQIQIAHNVFIDEDTVIAAQVGIAGSTKIGKRCMIGGQSGIVGHLTICDDVIIGASVGVSKSIDKPGLYTGYRAKPASVDLKREALINQLEDLRDKINKLIKGK